MKTIIDLPALARKHKNKIWKYFFSTEYYTNSLGKFQKHELNALLLLTLESNLELCRFLGKTFDAIEKSINHPKYIAFQIAKKKGGKRDIFAPDKELKKIQKKLNYFFQAYYLCIKPEQVHGFVINPHYLGKNCNIAENASIHINNKYVLNIDLKDFFPSISAKQVKQIFQSPVFNFNEQISTALTLLTTYEGKLPIGAPSSPVISNFVCSKLDLDLIHFSKIECLNYSRYADDLTFSSNSIITNDDILDIINIIQKNNFKINEKKLRLKTSNRKQTVTGLTVNDKVNVDRILLKKIRAMLHDYALNGLQKATQNHFKLKSTKENRLDDKFINRLGGYINFVGQVRGKGDVIYIKFKKSFELELIKKTLVSK